MGHIQPIPENEKQLTLDQCTVKCLMEELARTNTYVQYGRLADLVTEERGEFMDHRGFGGTLGRIQGYCFDLELPSLPVMVTTADSQIPGSGFMERYREIHPETKAEDLPKVRLAEKKAVMNCSEWQRLYDYLGIKAKAPANFDKYPKWRAGDSYKEGARRLHEAKMEIERSQQARKQCLLLKGATCAICGTNVAEKYGLKWDVVEVHHIHPLANREEPINTDAEKDLVPLCPTCHSVVHSKHSEIAGDCYTIEEVKGMLGIAD